MTVRKLPMLYNLMFASATSGQEEETGYTHENVKKIRFNGNEYAFGNASVANKKNCAVIPQTSGATGGVRITPHKNIVEVLGIASGVNDIFLDAVETDIPAGTYKGCITPYNNDTTLTTGKNMYMDFWYEGATDYSIRATFGSVLSDQKVVDITFEQKVVKMRVIVGVRAATYNDYRLFFELYPNDVQFTDLGSPVPADGCLDYTFETEQAFVDSRMHTSTIKK